VLAIIVGTMGTNLILDREKRRKKVTVAVLTVCGSLDFLFA
jgi:hypothetical protein